MDTTFTKLLLGLGINLLAWNPVFSAQARADTSDPKSSKSPAVKSYSDILPAKSTAVQQNLNPNDLGDGTAQNHKKIEDRPKTGWIRTVASCTDKTGRVLSSEDPGYASCLDKTQQNAPRKVRDKANKNGQSEGIGPGLKLQFGE